MTNMEWMLRMVELLRRKGERCPKCRGTRILADRRTLKPYGWRVWCGGSKPCQWSVIVSQREIVGTAILRWLAKDGGHIR